MIVWPHTAGTRARWIAVAPRPRWSRRVWLVLAWLLLAMPGARVVASPAGPDTADATGIVGDWLVADHGAIIRIQQVGDRFEGYIAWQLHDTYGPEDGLALDGKTVTDRNNPDPALRERPLTGLRLLTGLRYDPADGKWIDGRVYDTENGRTYRCRAWLDGPNKLVFRGYVGIPLLGRDTHWRRVVMQAPAAGGLPYVLADPAH